MPDLKEGDDALWRGKVRVKLGRPLGAGDFVIRHPDGREIAAPANDLRAIEAPPSDQTPGLIRK